MAWVLAAALVVAAGAWGLHASRHAATIAIDPSAVRAPWLAVDGQGRPLVQEEVGTAGLTLPARAELRLTEEDYELNRHELVTLRVRRLDELGHCELDLRMQRGRGFRVLVELGTRPKATAEFHDGEGRTETLLSGELPSEVAVGTDLLLTAALRPGGFEFRINGEEVLKVLDNRSPNGFACLRARGGPLRVTALRVQGVSTAQYGEPLPFVLTELFPAQAQTPRPEASADSAGLPSWRSSVGLALAALLAAIAWLSFLSSAPLRLRFQAAVLLLGPPALLLFAAHRVGAPAAEAVALAAALPGFTLVLALLRRHRLPAPSRGRLVRLGLASALLAGCAWAVSHWQWLAIAPRLSAEEAAISAPSPEPVRADETLHLGADNAWTPAGRWRDLKLSAEIELARDTLLAVRLRAPTAARPKGALLLLSSDPRLGCGFRHEDAVAFQPLGTGGPSLPADQPLALEVWVRGREFEARLGGRIVAQAESLAFAAGQVTLIALRGSAELRNVVIEPLPAAAPPARWPALLGAALILPALAVGFAALLAWRLGLGLLTSLAATSFALLPMLAAWGSAPARLELTNEQAMLATFASGFLLAAPCVMWGRRRGPQVLALALLGLFAAPAVVWWSPLQQGLSSESGVNGLSYTSWPDERLEDDLVWLQHPLLRRWNDYLARHELRGESPPLVKPEGTQRVLTLGGSGTWGWRIPQTSRAEWPAQLEQLLNAPASRGGQALDNVEVLNGAYIGATSTRLYRFLRDGLTDYDPDVVVLSVFFNDSAALSQGDEEQHFRVATAPERRRGLLDSLLEDRERQRERACLKRMGLSGLCFPDAAERWQQAGLKSSPPQRFTNSLTRFAQLAQERGFTLILVPEAIAGDAPYLWKHEFYANMWRVGREHDALVVDPTPALQAAGGADHFIDEVHLKPSGHRIVARVLAPLVAKVLSADPSLKGSR
ncbi:MAG: SGNH/GDSL hydrolase family protein [Planctomycetota bacterium]